VNRTTGQTQTFPAERGKTAAIRADPNRRARQENVCVNPSYHAIRCNTPSRCETVAGNRPQTWCGLVLASSQLSPLSPRFPTTLRGAAQSGRGPYLRRAPCRVRSSVAARNDPDGSTDKLGCRRALASQALIRAQPRTHQRRQPAVVVSPASHWHPAQKPGALPQEPCQMGNCVQLGFLHKSSDGWSRGRANQIGARRRGLLRPGRCGRIA